MIEKLAVSAFFILVLVTLHAVAALAFTWGWNHFAPRLLQLPRIDSLESFCLLGCLGIASAYLPRPRVSPK